MTYIAFDTRNVVTVKIVKWMNKQACSGFGFCYICGYPNDKKRGTVSDLQFLFVVHVFDSVPSYPLLFIRGLDSRHMGCSSLAPWNIPNEFCAANFLSTRIPYEIFKRTD